MELVARRTPKNANLTATEQPKRRPTFRSLRGTFLSDRNLYRISGVSASSGGLRWPSREFILRLRCYSASRCKSARDNGSAQNRREAKSVLTTSQPTKWNGTTRQRGSII